MTLPPVGLFADFPNEFRRNLAAAGFEIIEPDGRTFKSFNGHGWRLQSFLARKDGTVWVPLVWAMHPGRGSFSKLVREIAATGDRIAVLAALGHLATVLTHWGWVETRELVAGSVEHVFRPPEHG